MHEVYYRCSSNECEDKMPKCDIVTGQKAASVCLREVFEK